MLAKLVPLTDEACRAIADDEIVITAFPFRVGRDSRAHTDTIHKVKLWEKMKPMGRFGDLPP